jgi:hypothetical protein
MGGYPNVNKILKITYIDPTKMRLEDESKWKFLPSMPPPSSWKGGDSPDQVRVEELDGKFKSDSLYAIRGVSKKGTDTQAQYLGGAKGGASDINVTKSMSDTEYPAAYLGKELEIKKATKNIIVLEDQSVWKLTAALTLTLNRRAINDWQPQQYVTISRDPGKSTDIRTYKVKNEKTGVTLIGTFEGWER